MMSTPSSHQQMDTQQLHSSITTNTPSPALVWVTVGRTQHAALLLQPAPAVAVTATATTTTAITDHHAGYPSCGSGNGCLVQWTSTGRREWVDPRTIEYELTPRRQRQSRRSQQEQQQQQQQEQAALPPQPTPCDTTTTATTTMARQRRRLDDDDDLVMTTTTHPMPRTPAVSSKKRRVSMTLSAFISSKKKNKTNHDSEQSQNCVDDEDRMNDIHNTVRSSNITEEMADTTTAWKVRLSLFAASNDAKHHKNNCNSDGKRDKGSIGMTPQKQDGVRQMAISPPAMDSRSNTTTTMTVAEKEVVGIDPFKLPMTTTRSAHAHATFLNNDGLVRRTHPTAEAIHSCPLLLPANSHPHQDHDDFRDHHSNHGDEHVVNHDADANDHSHDDDDGEHVDDDALLIALCDPSRTRRTATTKAAHSNRNHHDRTTASTMDRGLDERHNHTNHQSIILEMTLPPNIQDELVATPLPQDDDNSSKREGTVTNHISPCVPLKKPPRLSMTMTTETTTATASMLGQCDMTPSSSKDIRLPSPPAPEVIVLLDDSDDDADDDDTEISSNAVNADYTPSKRNLVPSHRRASQNVTIMSKPIPAVHANCVIDVDQDDPEPLPANKQEENTSTAMMKRSYSCTSSAYMQNLAEIAFAMLHDRRWRVVVFDGVGLPPSSIPSAQSPPHHNQTLFRWEHGDDLRLVTALSRYYIRPNKNNSASIWKCRCLLCRDDNNSHNKTNDQKVAAKKSSLQSPQQASADNNSNAPSPTRAISQSCYASAIRPELGPTHGSDDMDNSDRDNEGSTDLNHVKDDEHASALYLVCRLFYRKGPWFRLDEVYQRYYAPKEKAVRREKPIAGTVSHPSQDGGEASNTKLHFFFARKTTIATTGTDATKFESLIDQSLLERYLSRLQDLLADLVWLQSSGLVRSFANEEECGKTVGMELLTADERAQILSMLGGGGGKRKSTPAINTKKEVTFDSTGRVSSAPNEIWQQMSRQQSITALPRSWAKVKIGNNNNNCSANNRVQLPVRSHVDRTLMERLSKWITQACSHLEYLPAPVLRTKMEEVKGRIRLLFQSTVISSINREASNSSSKSQPFEHHQDASTTIHLWCLRLQEEPALMLLRCCRLYLCATSGPGDMRHNGTNGWKSLFDLDEATLPLRKILPPPGRHSWHQVFYPGLAHRFGLNSFGYLKSFEWLLAADRHCSAVIGDGGSGIHIDHAFYSLQAFHAWEMAVEIRAHVDYLMELNEALRYERRRRDRGLEPRAKGAVWLACDSVDLLGLLDPSRGHIRKVFLGACHDGLHVEAIDDRLFQDMSTCLESIDNQCERVLTAIALLVIELLDVRNRSIKDQELNMMMARPWLRHLWWDGCLAYVLWDIIPILERQGHHQIAIAALQLLLFGFRMDIESSEVYSQINKHLSNTTQLAPLLLSRRARGKAFDRLVIDYTHLYRKGSKIKKESGVQADEKPEKKVKQFCEAVVQRVSHTAAIGFSAIRVLARRLKQPLATTLVSCFCMEASELGLRLDTPDMESLVPSSKAKSTKYTDWTPPTDRTIANALKNIQTGPGRCAFVGLEDEKDLVAPESLNVEQLAMEYYHSGQLPEPGDSMATKGGWKGWHDEGGHIRALFRILCSAPVLGMDWGCGGKHMNEMDCKEQATVHLTPYQSASFDLHVGFEASTEPVQVDSYVPSKCFYYRRQVVIYSFLKKLETLTRQELCDLVHEAIETRLNYMKIFNRKDPVLVKDLQQLRTLSMIAAGCGGQQLSSIFRCFFFDYRHYSGGLPDLLLVRAVVDETSIDQATTSELIDLGEWVGESFSSEVLSDQTAARGAAMLSDRDDEFLGCSKVGDSASRGPWRPNRSRAALSATGSQVPTLQDISMPERLELVHAGRSVRPECLMVEVKSSNDRLDPRQEDWLNILDRFGNARVCKFEEKLKENRKQTGVAASEES